MGQLYHLRLKLTGVQLVKFAWLNICYQPIKSNQSLTVGGTTDPISINYYTYNGRTNGNTSSGGSHLGK